MEKKSTSSRADNSTKVWKTTALILAAVVIFTQIFDISIEPKFSLNGLKLERNSTSQSASGELVDTSKLNDIVLPSSGVELPIAWGDLGKKMIADGVIDEQKFRALFESGLKNDEEQMLSGEYNGKVVLNPENSRFMLDMLWAFGLSNKNDILENGEMTSEEYGGDASGFASTGGWSLSSTPAMNHYSNYEYVTLSTSQQELVDKVSLNIYRPCCGNSTHFPDCNHGMAMLGLLELMAANGVSEDEMYRVALKVSSYWFPQTYLDLATYFEEQGVQWEAVDAKLALSSEFSSARGYQETREKIKSLPKPEQGGGGCGV